MKSDYHELTEKLRFYLGTNEKMLSEADGWIRRWLEDKIKYEIHTGADMKKAFRVIFGLADEDHPGPTHYPSDVSEVY